MQNIMKELRGRVSEKTEIQFVKFLIFAGLAAFVNVTSRFLLSEYILFGYVTAIATAYFLGGIVNFTLNKIYTFPKGHRRSHQEARTFVVIAIIGLVLTNLFALFFLYISINILDILISPKLIEIYSHIVAVGLVAIYSFLGHKHLTFKGGIRKYFSKGKLQ